MNSVPELSPNNSANTSNVKTIWQVVWPKFLQLLNISAVLVAIGFFIVQSYIASFSNFFTFNISIAQYLAAGINLCLAIVWNYVVPILILGLTLLLAAGVVFVVYFIVYVAVNRRRPTPNRWQTSLEYQLRHLLRILDPINRVTRVIAIALFIFLVILVGFLYGTFYYAQSPRMFGGGMPADVILVFREQQTTQNSIWGFPISSTNQQQSEPLQLLIELTDGVIVRYPTTNTVTIVRNDAFQGIIDVSSQATSSINATPTATSP